jgi:hypothetical protein
MHGDLTLPLTIRPPLLATLSWFTATTLIGVAFYFVFHLLLDMPLWALSIVATLVLGAFVSGILIARAFVTFSHKGFTHRFLTTRTYLWSDIKQWTQWGHDGSFFLRTTSDRTILFSHWLVFGNRNQIVYDVLVSHLGAESKGAKAVLPDVARALFGSMILSPEQADEREPE